MASKATTIPSTGSWPCWCALWKVQQHALFKAQLHAGEFKARRLLQGGKRGRAWCRVMLDGKNELKWEGSNSS
eukprot:1160492-Pelagomonas_calceolata.AAC.7